MDRVPADRTIVTRFVEHLREEGHPGLEVNCWPEDENPGQWRSRPSRASSRSSTRASTPFQISAASEKQFEEALAIVERLPVSARLAINVPYELVRVGTDWQAFRLALADWILNVAPGLPDGVHEIELPNTGLRCTARKSSDWQHRVVLSRPAPDDDTLAVRVRAQITRKMEKLRRYKDRGCTTVLLLESKDQSLMNQYKMLDATREAVGGELPDGLPRGTCMQLLEPRWRTEHVSSYDPPITTRRKRRTA